MTERGLAREVLDRDVLYVPDFLANCGGIIHVGAEFLDYDEERVEALIAQAIARTDSVVEDAGISGLTPLELAEAHAAERLRGARGTQMEVA